MRLVLYCRVSTEEQATEGVSLAAQRARGEAYAKLYGHELVAVEEDAGISAKSLRRPGLRRALKALRAGGADGVLVAKLDRLTRSVGDLAQLVERYFTEGRGALLSVGEAIDTATAAGRMVLNMLGVLAQWEREAIGERTREALRHKRARGARLGAVPLGWRRQGDVFVEDEAEQRVLARARELAAAGVNLSAIGRTLTAEGLRTKRGGAWQATTVRKLLARVGR